MRHLTLVGKVYRNTKVIKLASRCAWCRKWASMEDYRAAHEHGAKVSHGCCSSCAAKLLAEIDAMPPGAA